MPQLAEEHETNQAGGSVPTPDAFRRECTVFLAAHYPRKQAVRSEFRWGEGSDAVDILEEADPEEEAASVARVKAYQRLLWDNGLGWVSGPVEYGGRGLPSEYARIFDVVAREFDLPRRDMLLASLSIVAPTILNHGTEEAKQRYLPGMHAGDLVGCQLFSEPGAGSDLASVSARAERDGDGWRITGQKVWTSGAHYSDLGEVLCRTGAGPRHGNLTMFVVDMHQPGVEVRPLRQMTGGASFNEVFLTDVYVPDANRLGEVGGGWRVAVSTLATERAALGGSSGGGLGVLRTDRYIEMLRAFGCDTDPVMRQRLAELVTNLRIAKYTIDRAVAARRAGRVGAPEASVGKLQYARNYQRITELVSAVLGPRLVADTGEWGTYAWTALVLGAPGTRIGGGTDEVLKNVIAERVLGLPKEPSATADADRREN